MITANGMLLDDPQGRWWVSAKTGETVAPSLNLASVGLDIGAIDAPSPGYGPAVWPLVMGVRGDGLESLRRHRAALDAVLLDRHRLIEFVTDGERMCHGIVTATEVEAFGTRRLDIGYQVRIPSGRWFDAFAQQVTVSATNRVSGTDADGVYRLPALLGGSRDMDPTITTVGNGSSADVRVTDVASGQWVRIAGNITAGAAIVIDPVALTATVAGAAASGLLDFSERPFHLSPDATVRVQRNGVQAVTIRARRAYA